MTSTELAACLTLDLDEVEVVGADEYDIAGVYSFGRGLFARSRIFGSETSYRKLNRLHKGQLVLSRLKAFEGAVAVVPAEFDGWFLSPEFPTFRCIDNILDSGYLAHVCRWPDFWSLLSGTSKGIGARRERVRPAGLLSVRLDLPGVDEQHRRAEQLDQVKAVAAGVRQCTERATELSHALAVSIATRPDLDEPAKSREGWRRVRLRSAMQPTNSRVTVKADEFYPNVGIYSFGRGLFKKPDIDGSSTSATTLYRIKAGEFIYSRLFAFEGAYAYVSPDFGDHYVSNEFPSFETDPEQLDAQWLAAFLRSPERWAELGGRSKGLGVRRQRVPVEAVLDYEVPLPPITTQRAMVAMIDGLERASVARQAALQHIDALLPAVLNDTFAAAS